jgi:hypothetical protein
MIVSSARLLRVRLPISSRLDFLVSDKSLGFSSSMLKLLLRFDVLGSPLVSLFNASCPFLSTATKLVRTFERGRGEVPVLPPPRKVSCRGAWVVKEGAHLSNFHLENDLYYLVLLQGLGSRTLRAGCARLLTFR